MNIVFLYALVGVGLFSLGLYALIMHAHLLRKILAINIMGSGTFLVLVALGGRSPGASPDPVPPGTCIDTTDAGGNRSGPTS
jgi:multicomponent Na+:H+ antiporter subunit C